MDHARIENVYQDLRRIVAQLPETKRAEAQWAEIRPEPPKHMNLALQPRPTHFGRLCRFRVGDAVRVCHQLAARRVVAVECPELKPAGWSHCMGNDAIYTLDDGSRRGDVELSFAQLDEHELLLPSGERVRVVVHQDRLVSLVDGNHKPVGAEDLYLDDWHYLFFKFLPLCGKVARHGLSS